MDHNILHAIIEKKQTAPPQHPIPAERQHPIVPFLHDIPVICEIKRRSPSKGNIASELDILAQAGQYAKAGITSISVLTEEHYFNGSVADLMAIKAAFPHCAVLQKDFLLSKEDIEIAYRIGADAVLLLASVLTPEIMAEMLDECRRLGLAALVEIHNTYELQSVAPLQPAITGINARDLRTFLVDPLLPLALRSQINWNTRCIFESGIQSTYGLQLALHGGFDGILVGEAVVRDAGLTHRLVDTYRSHASSSPRKDTSNHAQSRSEKGNSLASTQIKPLDVPAKNSLSKPHSVSDHHRFWNNIAQRIQEKKSTGLPLVKICGICSQEDAQYAMESGADILGFIMVPSQRRVDAAFLASLARYDILKVAVVELSTDARELDPTIDELLRNGYIDALQLHGDEPPEVCEQLFPSYKALRPQDDQYIKLLDTYPSPRILLDAYSPHAKGGTGLRIADDLLQLLPEGFPLWLAGGITPDNVADIIRTYRPECIDISSGLEETPAKKSHTKIEQFFKAIASTRLS